MEGECWPPEPRLYPSATIMILGVRLTQATGEYPCDLAWVRRSIRFEIAGNMCRFTIGR
jgi:hypothetical protein